MRLILALALLLPAACTTAPAPVAAIVPAAVQTAGADVEASVVKRFGAAALARARAADEFIAVKRYPGLPQPPHDTDGRPVAPYYPVGLLFREKGRWLAYGMEGLHPMLPRWSDNLEKILRDPRLLAEPVDGGILGCTDAGGSFVLMRIAGTAEHARIGHCGGSPLTEQLVGAALMG